VGAAQRSKAALSVFSRTQSESELSHLVGVIADETWQIGAVRQGSQTEQVYPDSGLRYLSHASESVPPSEHLAELLKRVSPAAGRLAEFAERASKEDPGIVPYRYGCIWRLTTSKSGCPSRPRFSQVSLASERSF
jgi:hypothetical protein